MSRCRHAFTLVELLVVIGIIAVLISILLPALSAARRSAQAVKCAAALREIGNCFQMYASENKGYAPVAKTIASYHLTYNSQPPIDSFRSQYWAYFLAKYVTHKVMGLAGTASQRADARANNILWGCPSFEGYLDAAYTGGVDVYDSGYGMNAFPEYTSTYPKVAGPANTLGDPGFAGNTDANAIAVVSTPGNNSNLWNRITVGRWYKLTQWTHPAERALVADTRFWILECQACPLNGQIPPQPHLADNIFWSSATGNGETGYDFYRHGKYPKLKDATHFDTQGGTIGYNILFADGHVTKMTTREDGYRAARMRFPG